MKNVTAIILAGVMMLIGFQLVSASDNDSKGYQSKFYGTVEEMPSGHTGIWIVNNRRVEITPRTKIEEEYGRLGIGAYVEIEGRSDGETFYAREVEVKRSHDDSGSRSYHEYSDSEEFYGIITAMPQGMFGKWSIDGRDVYVTEATRIEERRGTARVGAGVEVKGSDQDGKFVIRELEVKR